MDHNFIPWRREQERIPLGLIVAQALLVMVWGFWVSYTYHRLTKHLWLTTWPDLLTFTGLLVLLMVLHEGCHYLGQRHYGVRCALKFGWWGVAISPQGPVVREQKLVTTLLPHVLLTPPLVAAALFMRHPPLQLVGFWCGVAAALNAILGAHDLYNWLEWYRMPRHTRAVREGPAVVLYVPRQSLPFDPQVPEI